MTNAEAKKVCTVITAITGNEAVVLTDWGNWDGQHYVGYAAQVNIPGWTLIHPAPTQIEAACDLLTEIRKRFPEKAAKASRMRKCAEGMAIYAAHVEAKTDAAIAESAARLADMRTPVRGADLSATLEAAE